MFSPARAVHVLKGLRCRPPVSQLAQNSRVYRRCASSSHREGNPGLATANSTTLGTSMPEITLPGGDVVQTGTMAALLINIKSYNNAHAAGDAVGMAQFESAIGMAVPLLRKVGLFDVFPPEEWAQGSNEGRKLVGRLALKE